MQMAPEVPALTTDFCRCGRDVLLFPDTAAGSQSRS